jgi:nucleotide-binding universal stress UspA family protein
MRKKDFLDKILVPLDGSKGGEAVIPYIEELASRLKIEVTFLQAMELDYMVTSETQLRQLESLRASAQEYIDSMAARFKQKGITAKAEVREVRSESGGGVDEEIIKLANEINAYFVAMSTRGRSASDERPGEQSVTKLGSVAEKMVQSGNIPLFLVKPRAVK